MLAGLKGYRLASFEAEMMAAHTELLTVEAAVVR